MTESSIIADWDDKFGLAEIRDPFIILNHLKESIEQYEFSDITYFLKKLVLLK